MSDKLKFDNDNNEDIEQPESKFNLNCCYCYYWLINLKILLLVLIAIGIYFLIGTVIVLTWVIQLSSKTTRTNSELSMWIPAGLGHSPGSSSSTSGTERQKKWTRAVIWRSVRARLVWHLICTTGSATQAWVYPKISYSPPQQTLNWFSIN